MLETMTESDEGNGNNGENDQPLPGESEEQTKARKRKERLEQNRISARESRKRKKTMIEELQRTVITLSRENKELNERNEQLRRNLMEIATKVRLFHFLNLGWELITKIASPGHHHGVTS